jgi:NitT/TauT family transport system substrate-binding protein
MRASRREFLTCLAQASGAAVAGAQLLAAETRTSIRVATGVTPPSIHGIWLHVAYERGFFKRNGLDVTEFLQLRGGPLAMQALTSGHVDIAPADPEGVMAAALAGHPVRAVSAPGAQLAYFVAVRNEVRSIGDLRGSSFAISRPGAISQYLMYPLLDRASVPRDSVKWLSVGGGFERMLALRANRVQGALLNVDFAMQMINDPNIKIMQSLSDILPDYPGEMLVLRKDILDTRRDVAIAITRSVLQACRHIVRNKADTIEVVLKYTPAMNTGVLSRAYDELIRMRGFGVDGGMTEANLKVAHDLALQNGQIRHAIPLERWVDLKIQASALESLGSAGP